MANAIAHGTPRHLWATEPAPGHSRNRLRYRRNSLAHASWTEVEIRRAGQFPGGVMKSTKVNGVELEYEVSGSGESLLFISSVLADGFTPLLSQPALADRYQLIRYHRRGWGGSTQSHTPVSVEDHAADAAALLHQLGVPRAHVAGHSTGGVVGAQLALDEPAVVQTLVL